MMTPILRPCSWMLCQLIKAGVDEVFTLDRFIIFLQPSLKLIKVRPNTINLV